MMFWKYFLRTLRDVSSTCCVRHMAAAFATITSDYSSLCRRWMRSSHSITTWLPREHSVQFTAIVSSSVLGYTAEASVEVLARPNLYLVCTSFTAVPIGRFMAASSLCAKDAGTTLTKSPDISVTKLRTSKLFRFSYHIGKRE